MYLTEYEAQGKICCQDPHSSCVASKCMGWRFEKLINYKPGSLKSDLPSTPILVVEYTEKGYCGLAGKP